MGEFIHLYSTWNPVLIRGFVKSWFSSSAKLIEETFASGQLQLVALPLTHLNENKVFSLHSALTDLFELLPELGPGR